MTLKKRAVTVYEPIAVSSQGDVYTLVSVSCAPWETATPANAPNLRDIVLSKLSDIPRTARDIAKEMGLTPYSVSNILMVQCVKGTCASIRQRNSRAHLYRRANMEDA
jgi:hypothetical protein